MLSFFSGRREAAVLRAYIIKRTLLAVVTVFIISAITFFAMNAIPGGPFDAEKAPTEAVKAVLEQRFSLDKPVWQQYFIYLGNIFRGDFGISLKTGREVSAIIGESFPVSARIGGIALIVALVFGVLLGSAAAISRGGIIDRLTVFFSTLMTAVPSFVLATLLLLVFSIRLSWVRVWSAEGSGLILPVISLAMYPMAYITRLTKSSMLDVLGQDYIRTARAKGVPAWKLIFKHALRNALTPVVTYVGPMTAYILTGSLVVETVFTIGGLGSNFVSGITNRDYPLIMATTIFLATLMVFMNLISDLVYKLLDPRVNFESGGKSG